MTTKHSDQPQRRAPDRSERRSPMDNTVRVGFPFTPLTDLYFLLLKGSWWWVLGVFVVGFLLINVGFAALYLLGGDCIAGARPGSFRDAFFFSVQSVATIGYGTLTPATDYANALVTFEAMFGILGTALATGIVFAKFARPRANVRFTNNIVISPYDGKRSLYFRVANIRGNDVAEASVNVAVLQSHTTAEGHTLRRLQEVPLVRSTTPMFRLSWLVVHVIDEHSPLWGLSYDDLLADRTMIVVSLMGMDSTFAQSVTARHVYMPQDVVFDHHFEDIIEPMADGRLQFHYSAFQQIRPLTPAELGAGGCAAADEDDGVVDDGGEVG